MTGFLCVPREVWTWKNKARRDAYIDLQMRCSWGEQHFRSQGQSVAVQAGEVLFSAREAALWWDCTEKAVRGIMEWLEAEGLISYPEGKQHRRMFRVAMVTYWGDVQGARKGASRGDSKGDSKGARKGASNFQTTNELPDVGAQEKAQARAQGRAQGRARYIGDEFREEIEITVPTEPCAAGGADLFGERPTERPPAPPAAVLVKASDVAQRVLVVFHDLSKAHGGNGVAQPQWAAQRKMAESAINKGLSEQEATDALRWGMREEWQRTRLRAHGMKVLMDVWSAWVEHTGGTNGRSGNGRNGARGAGGEIGAGEGEGSGPGGYSVVGGMATRYPDARRNR